MKSVIAHYGMSEYQPMMRPLSLPNLKRWVVAQRIQQQDNERLAEEAARLRARNAELQKAKARAESRIESLRREKDAQKIRASAFKKDLQEAEQRISHLVAKVEELRAEVERLSDGRNRKKPPRG
ncbi:MAG TPA: hypothetical protein VGE01_01750 [Fimbriimonas sp.]